MKQIDLNAFLNETASLGRTTALFQEAGLRGFLLHIQEGEQIPEHQTRGPISVHCLKGEVVFSSGSDQVTLTPATLVNLLPAAPHSLIARQESLLLVTLSEQAAVKPA